MRRIQQTHSTLLNNTLSQLDNFTTAIGKPINVYKFRKVSGIIKYTNEGEKSLKYSNNKFQQTTNIYTGKEPIVVVWSGSTKTFADENGIEIYKEMKVGEYYKLYSDSPNTNSLVVDNISILNKEYVNSYVDKDISLTSYDWIPNDDDILEYVYLILDNVNQSYQWLEIESITPYFNEETKKFQQCEINFSNLNMKYSKTGKTILDFIQLGGIGEGYAFPKETELSTGEIVVSLDEEKKIRENDGTNQLQFDFNSGAGNSSFLIWGRKKEVVLDDGTIKLEAPHILLPYKCNFPKTSPFFYNRPNLNSYAYTNWLPTKEGIWKSYKDAYKGNERIGEYNIDKQKEVLVGFKHNLDNVRNSNKNMNQYINWDNYKSVNINIDVNLEPIPYVNKNTKNINRNVNYCEFFTINAFINFYTDVFSYDYRETTKYKLTDVLGILGGLVNILVNGLDIGWTSTASLAPTQPINFLLPCISFEDGKSALSDDAPLPSDIFVDDNIKKVLPTATNVLTSWNFNLTDRFIDRTLVLDGKPLGKGGNGVWDTKYLGQTTDEDGNLLFDDGRELTLNLQEFSPTYPSTTDNQFIIDYVDFKAVSSCDYRLSAYNKNDENIYSCYLETNAKARNEITIWGNTLKFNYYDEFNTLGQVSWPKIADVPKPNIENIGFELLEMQNADFCIISGNFWDIDINSGWNGELKTFIWYTIIPGPGVISTTYGENSRLFKPDNNSYLFKDNVVSNEYIYNCNIEEINPVFFDRVLIKLNYGLELFFNFSLGKQTQNLENFIFLETKAGTFKGFNGYSDSQRDGGIMWNVNKLQPSQPSVPSDSDKLLGKDYCLLGAFSDEVEFNFEILEINNNNLSIKLYCVYKQVKIYLQDEKYDKLWTKYISNPGLGNYPTYKMVDFTFKNLFSNIKIEKCLLLPKE